MARHGRIVLTKPRRIPVYGRLEQLPDHAGRMTPHWVDAQILIGIPYDMPIVGYGGRTTNGLRLYRPDPPTSLICKSSTRETT